ncbi:unnamed protein product [Zymoseptoria tritici ST99CH_1E4]|uniref:Uncharacterized protein n=2 Tax=Zymoseptoria tritici TaxID=1047171 RepID=F9XHS0_ZYMTI|nr:uncharacterized protein MYCGRDRAFT_94872 [Zymoseptoria tritici IPO323]EGP84840.1 hypothetical protein MYCGRDRAFT_94872 [Zymoseptoria tritici IPO323]SMR56580.1 unnamed protein product [Zymoseptoria tritici ST99CH_1E4]
MSYNYQIAKDAISQPEKDRAFCIFLNTTNGVTNWEKATTDFKSASVDSMKVSWRNTLKKIEKAGGKLDGGDTSTTPATPKSSAKKRKVKEEDSANDGEDVAPTTPAPKKQGRGKKAAASTIEKSDDGEYVEAGVPKTPAPKKRTARKTVIKAENMDDVEGADDE